MPKSRVRKRGGRPVAPHAQRNHRAAMVEQRRIAVVVDDLDELLAAIPTGYNPTDMSEIVEHHHHCDALVRYMRDQRVVDLLAALAGGEMIAVPTAEAGEQGGPAVSYAEMVDAQAQAQGLPRRTPGSSRDASGATVAEALTDPATAPCLVCGRTIRVRPDGRLYPHGKGGGSCRGGACWAERNVKGIPRPRREVIR